MNSKNRNLEHEQQVSEITSKLRFQSVALVETLCNALKHTHYQITWKKAFDTISLETLQGDPFNLLQHLPLTYKKNLAEDLPPIVQPGDEITSIIHTTGTTGPITYRYRSKRELKEIAALYKEVANTIRTKPRPHILMFYGPYHGKDFGLSGIDTSSAPNVFSGAVWDDIFIRQALDLLRRHFDIPRMESRVGTLSGAVRLVRVFTQCAIDQNFNPSESGIQALSVFAGYMPQEVRSFLLNYWRLEPVEIFSLSEILGGARKCPCCSALSFDAHIIPEVVSLNKENAISDGIGRLVATELLPFGRAQPLVRYVTGDIVRKCMIDCPACGHDTKLIHLGRENESLFLEENGEVKLILASSELREIAYCPEIARSVEFPHLKMLHDRITHLGMPHIKVELLHNDSGSKRIVYVKLKPKYSNDDLEELLTARFLSISKSLKDAVDDGTVELRFSFDPTLQTVLVK